MYKDTYRDLMLNDILPEHIEKLTVDEDNDKNKLNKNGVQNDDKSLIENQNVKENKNLDKTEIIKVSKSQIAREKIIAEELEKIKNNVNQIISYKTGKELSIQLINSCNKVSNLLDDLKTSKTIIDFENVLLNKIKEKENIINLSGSIVSEGTDVRTFTSSNFSPSFLIENTLKDEKKELSAININGNNEDADRTNIFTNILNINNKKYRNSTDQMNIQNIQNINPKNDNRTETPVNAGNPYNNDNNDNNDNDDKSGTEDDSMASAISDLLGSIFKGFRGGGERGSDSDKDVERKTATEPLAERTKSTTSVRYDTIRS